MLLYLAGQTHHDITYAVNCAARYIVCPYIVQKRVLMKIGCYLKATSDKGLIIKHSEKLLRIDIFPYANFSEMHGHVAMDFPISIKIRTG